MFSRILDVLLLLLLRLVIIYYFSSGRCPFIGYIGYVFIETDTSVHIFFDLAILTRSAVVAHTILYYIHYNIISKNIFYLILTLSRVILLLYSRCTLLWRRRCKYGRREHRLDLNVSPEGTSVFELLERVYVCKFGGRR